MPTDLIEKAKRLVEQAEQMPHRNREPAQVAASLLRAVELLRRKHGYPCIGDTCGTCDYLRDVGAEKE